MSPVLSLALAMAFPFALLAMILWLSRLEESLPEDIRRTRRTPDPEPILRVPVRATPLPPPLLHQAMLVDAVLEHPASQAAEPLSLVSPASSAVPAAPADVEVPEQRTPDDQVPTVSR